MIKSIRIRTHAYVCNYFDNRTTTNPSISARSWLMVWREYGCMGDSIRFPPTLSNSSIKITQGALAFASSAGKGKQKYYCVSLNIQEFSLFTIIFIDISMQQRQGCTSLKHFILTEQVPDATCSNTHKHLIKLRPGRIVEWHICLPCHSSGKQSLSSTRRTDQEHSCKHDNSVKAQCIHFINQGILFIYLFKILYLYLWVTFHQVQWISVDSSRTQQCLEAHFLPPQHLSHAQRWRSSFGPDPARHPGQM